ncbi:Pentatricopeptide repeat-containing protein, partial [Thalictrum thalictroides]
MLSRYVRKSTTLVVMSHSFSTETTKDLIIKRGSGGATNTGGRDTLGRRLLSLIHPKRSAVVTIRKWAEEGKTVQKYELNRIVRELRKFKRYKHAIE